MNRYSVSTTAASVTTDCQEVYVPNEVFLVVGVLSLAENLLVVLAVICTPKLHSPMYLFICNLAAFNTLSSLCMAWESIMLAFSAAGHLDTRGTLERHLDDVTDSLLCTSFLGSFCSFLVIAVDRYITIFHALRYHVIVTCRRAIVVLGMTWALCGTSGALMIRFSHTTTTAMVTFIIMFLLALLLILPLYGHMFLLARKHAGHIASLPGATGAGRARLPGWRSMQAAVTLSILFGVFMVCWAPFFLHLLLLMLCPQDPYCECYRSLFQLHLLLSVSHAVIDPTIYAFRSQELRRSFRRMLRYPILRI
ncbi:adrenocorticotropic hormone receptor [Clupea harengus]|uniref:Adrenocorticotropic hormone receptor n=1 Tax=Clupea harengus TaxID=7950 RepID=A0A6P3VMK3_CLUHA|nr:adrenocorticotropic hormone receptor [Clupea harengus]